MAVTYNIPPVSADDIKAVVSDMDGTMLDTHHNVHPWNLKAIEALQQKYPEIPIIIATGRQRYNCDDYRRAMRVEKFPSIHGHGSCAYGPFGTITFRQAISPETKRKVIAFAEEHNVCAMFYTEKSIYMARKPVGPSRDWQAEFVDWKEEVHIPEPGWLETALSEDFPILKISIPVDESRVPDIKRLLFERFQSSEINMQQALSFCLELTPPGVDKSHALKKVLADCGISKDQVLAFGDGNNDIGMLSMVKYGVAMENAMPDAKIAAQYSTASNDAGGVAIVLNQVFRLGLEFQV